MRIVLLLIVVAVVGYLASRQLKTTVAVPQAVTAPATSGGASSVTVPITQAPKAVGDAAAQALQAGAAATDDKLKAAEGK
jgi:hypothetical protein